MYIALENIHPSSKLWIYQSHRKLNPAEAELIAARAVQFVESWTAHKQDLLATGTLLHNRFLVLAVDENQNGASGCSIDSSVKFVKQLGQELNIDFFDRMQVAYLQQDEVKTFHLAELEQKLKNGEVQTTTPVFNNLIQTAGELTSGWLVPMQNSWHAQFFPKS